MGLADRGGAYLAQPDAGDLALLDQFDQRPDGGLDRILGINPCTLEEVNGLATTQDFDSLVNRRSGTLGAAVGSGPGTEGALDAEHDLIGILGVLSEVILEQMQRVGLGVTVVYALRTCQYGYLSYFLCRGCTYTIPDVSSLF